jgi:hypothetical protein
MSLTGKSPLTTATEVANDGFWPALQVGDLLSKYRIPSEYDDSVIETGLILGLIRVNESMESVKTHVQANGFATFSDYLAANSTPVADAELLHIHYEHAVFSRAKAHLLQNFVTINRREAAENEAKESEQVEKYWLDESQKSVAAMLLHFFPDDAVPGSHNFHAALI